MSYKLSEDPITIGPSPHLNKKAEYLF